jgi:hypothetical protein
MNLAPFGRTSLTGLTGSLRADFSDRINRIYLSACDAQAGMILIYPVDPVKKMEIPILFNYNMIFGIIAR